jgi:hypothetical protein
MFRRSILLVGGVLLLSGAANLAFAQGNIQTNENLPTLPPIIRTSPNNADIYDNSSQNEKVQEARFAALRKEQIKRDSEKLFELSAKLKDQIDKGNGDVLSVESVKMVQQIEKLAHGLKQKMKD